MVIAYHVLLTDSGLRATSRKTRIETLLFDVFVGRPEFVSEQHPGKQGLKPRNASGPESPRSVSEQHPGKQGLKPEHGEAFLDRMQVSEQHPGKQGLKLRLRCRPIYAAICLRATSRKTRIET